MGTEQKKKKRTEDVRSLTSEIKRTQVLDVNKLALEPRLEIGYSPVGVGTTSYVNVSTSLGPSQGGSPPPPQVTGLTPTVISDTQINLGWTAYGGSDFNFYTVYRGTSSGFSADSSSDIAFPTTNSYNNTGLTASTAYYYRVATTNDASIEGPLSAEVSATTTGPPDVTPPGQVTGLSTTVISDTQINLVWTASGAGDLNHYDVHRSTTTGFTPAVGNRISQPTTNSYNNTGLTASTIYYYKVAAVDNASNIGTYSTQATGTTQAAGINPSLELHFDSNLTDTSPNGHVVDPGSTNGDGYLTPGQFGSAAKKINYPSSSDLIYYADTATLRMDPTVGFSISVWVYPVSNFTGSRKLIAEKRDNSSNMWTLQVEPSTLLVHFHVKEAGTDYKRVTAAGMTVNAWNHIAATFNSASNTIAVYKTAVAGNSSSAATQYNPGSGTEFTIGAQIGDLANTKFLGYIDEFRYYKGTVLNSTQVTNLMNTNDT